MSGLPSGYENYLSYEATSPATALAYAQNHRTAVLQAFTAAATSPSGASYNPAALQGLLTVIDQDIRRLGMKANRQGIARMQPCVRVDPIGTFKGDLP